MVGEERESELSMVRSTSSSDKLDAETFWRRLILPVEDRPTPETWTGSFRWFRSENVVDLWRSQSPVVRKRMIDLARRRWQNRGDGGCRWPP
jgi:hypothetical protein